MRISHASYFLAAILVAGLPLVSRAQEKAGTTLWRSIVENRDLKKEECERQQQVPPKPQNSLANPSNGVTPTGKRLQPFGEPNYWGGKPEEPSPDSMAELPPIPDLRTPDQVSKVEQKRNYRNAQYAVRHAEFLAKEEARKLEEAAALIPPPDPSTAMFQVQSEADQAPDACEKDLPDSANGGKLKPFGPGSAFINNGEVKFRSGQPIPSSLLVKEEEIVAELPPLPALRTPDQVSKIDQKRTFRISQFQERTVRNAEKKAEIERLNSEDASPTEGMDPSTALVQVESKVPGAVCTEEKDRPNTVNGGKLKPFNCDSAFVKSGQLMFKHDNTQFVETEATGLTEEEMAFDLPPLPDLRTPDQVTKMEKMRNLRNLKYRARQQNHEAMVQKFQGVQGAGEPVLAPFQQ